MANMRNNLVLIILLLFTTGCTLPLIWDDPVELTEPPVVIEISPTTTEEPEQVNPVDPPGPTDTPLLPEASPTTQPVTPVLALETPAPPVPSTPTPIVLPYVLQPGSPVAVPNFSRPELGCDWLGVGGQVFDRRGQPQPSVVIALGGTLAGIEVDKLVVSGGAPIFGEGGYEVTLSERPIGTVGTIWIQLYDIDGEPLSEKYFFDTVNDCAQNLVLINFVEVAAQPFGIWLPMIAR